MRTVRPASSGVFPAFGRGKNIRHFDVARREIFRKIFLAHQKDEVFVGRIRRDESQENSLNLWIVSDNLRKGAATNAVQIAEYLVEKKII